MKRRIFKLILFLLLGAIVNVAVAWGCAFTWPGYSAMMNVSDRDWPHGVPQGWPPPEVVNKYRGFGWAIETFFSETPLWSHGVNAHLSRAGWPVLTFKALHWEDPDAGVDEGGWDWHITLDTGVEVTLPLRPIWPGFATNTVFYAAVLSLLWSSPFVVRRLIRRKRGRCIKCGYDLRGDFSAGCPECGWRREARA